MSEDTKLAVKKGAAWLDQVYPEWIGVIDLKRLNLQDSVCCVLGQLGSDHFPGYYLFEDWAKTAWGEDDTMVFMVDHGFNMVPGTFENWGELTDAWKEYISDHR